MPSQEAKKLSAASVDESSVTAADALGAIQDDASVRNEARMPPLMYQGTFQGHDIMIMVDSGASGDYISADWVDRHKIQVQGTPTAIQVADGSVTHTLGHTKPGTMRIDGYQTAITPKVIPLWEPLLVLGGGWLKRANPAINWQTDEAVIKIKQREYHLKPTNASQGIPVVSAIQYKDVRSEDDEVYVIRSKSDAPLDNNPQVQAVLKDFADVFPENLPNELPPSRAIDFEIELEPGHTPPSRPTYRLSSEELAELKKTLDDLLSRGFIQPNVSPFGAPILFVKKKDGSR
ncbi:MAG: retropepsin-like aspartic protease, partial [Armatimonadota bacterium]